MNKHSKPKLRRDGTVAFVGNIERIEQGHVVGWVYQPEADHASALDVEIVFEGQVVGRGVAAGLRPDVAAANGPIVCGFEIPIASTQSLGSGMLSAQTSGEVFAERRVRGHAKAGESFAGLVEDFDGKEIKGWAVNFDVPNRPVVLAVHLGTRLVGYCGATLRRPDVEAQFGATIPLGFAYTVPLPLREVGPALFRFYIANTEIELGGSPFLATQAAVPNDVTAIQDLFTTSAQR